MFLFMMFFHGKGRVGPCFLVLCSLYCGHKTNMKGGVRLCLDLTEQAQQVQDLEPVGDRAAVSVLGPVEWEETGADPGAGRGQVSAAESPDSVPALAGAVGVISLQGRNEMPFSKKSPGLRKS